MAHNAVLSVSLPGPLVTLVRQQAAEQDRPVSRIIGEAVRDWAAKKELVERG